MSRIKVVESVFVEHRLAVVIFKHGLGYLALSETGHGVFAARL